MEFQAIGSTSLAAIITLTVLGVSIPLVLSVVWVLRTKESFLTIIIGALTFFVSAMVLESIPKAVLLNPSTGIGQAILSSAWATTLVAAFLAGLFEETGRLVAFKWLLAKKTDRKTCLTYGIGHGGGEMLILLVTIGLQFFSFAMMINSGTFGAVLEQVKAVSPDAVATYEGIAASLAEYSFGSVALSVVERFSAILIHISCSVIMFSAVREKGKFWLYPVAVLVHGSIDIIAGMYQTGLISNVYVIEIIIFLWALILFGLSYVLIYRKMQPGGNVSAPEAGDPVANAPTNETQK